MGLFVTLIIIALTYLSPAELIPEMAQFRVMIWLTAMAVFGSAVSAMQVQFNLRSIQLYFMFGYLASIMISRLSRLWFSGTLDAMWDFLSLFSCFILLLWNVRTISRLKKVMITMVALGIYMIWQGWAAVHFGWHYDTFVFVQRISTDGGRTIAEELLRIRGAGMLADPNDMAQFLIVGLPLLWIFWRRQSFFRNFFLVILPSAAIGYGIYMTYSRGAFVGIGVLILVVLSDRLGPVFAAIATLFGLSGLLALNYGGGRGFGLSDGYGRIEAWSKGLQLLKSSPIWGVGYNLFADYHVRTAHNSFVLVFAELGMLGFFFYLGILFVCIRQLNAIIKHPPVDELGSTITGYARALRASLWAYMATSWFLSRAYEPTLFVLSGMVAALAEIERNRGPNSRTLSFETKWIFQIVGFQVLIIAVLYAVMRIRSL